LLLIEPDVFTDLRGFLLESFHDKRYREAGIDATFVQDNESRSRRWALRGLHFQHDYPQGKLVRVLRGEVYDVAVDIRHGSPTFGQWEGVVLDDKRHCQIYIPVGFAHGFCVLSEEADLAYKCTDYYHPEDQRGIAWDDPDIGIDWPLSEPHLSEKDHHYPRLSEIDPEDLPPYETGI
jgi:dTDP-4-dehydrorhamnose 3,5-epimerase